MTILLITVGLIGAAIFGAGLVHYWHAHDSKPYLIGALVLALDGLVAAVRDWYASLN